jgi:hypothetical protein
MSIVAMKRKAATLNLSNQKNPLNIGFSLNNPRRVGAHSGEPQTQTPYRGAGAVGHGGPNTRSTITRSQYICVDAFDIPHVSVKNNRGYLSTKNKWLNRGYPFTVVKDCTPPTYETYLHKIKGTIEKNSTAQVNNGTCCAIKPGKKNNVGNYQKDVLHMNYTIYYKSKILKRECIPLPASKAHYPPQNVRPVSSCIQPVSLEQFMTIQAEKNC